MQQTKRPSTVSTRHDSAGDYEVEIFDTPHPRRIIVTSHGNGVRRWDGKHFFHNVAVHYADSTVMLVDQNQPEAGGVKLNALPVLAARVQGLITEAHRLHPGTSILLIAHSMGCGVATQLDLTGVSAVVFVTPGAGDLVPSYIERYGPDVVKGKVVTTQDGLHKHVSKEFMDSIQGLVWETEYAKLLERFHPVCCFEAADEEIVGPARLAHRDLPFADYQIIPHAAHNLSGAPLADFFARLDKLL